MTVDFNKLVFKMRLLHAIMDAGYSYKYVRGGKLQMIIGRMELLAWIQYAEQHLEDFGWRDVMIICNAMYHEHMDKVYEGQNY